jgi:phenol/toluene 2-monooxygenase (NADH) P1/A1
MEESTMQIDIKTTAVQPIRQTFSHVARRLGADKPASRYQEATLDLQPEANFHYRPLWQPEFELYDTGRTAIRMSDWYAFKDPRQFYYGAYTIARSRQQETMEKNIEFVTRRALLSGLPDAQKQSIAALMVPLRHVEWAANTNNCYVTAYGWGTAITQATMYHGMDRLGLAQYLSRIGLLLDGNQGSSLEQGKTCWLGDPVWQPLRRLVEDLMAVKDWFETFVAQNAVLDGLLYPLVYRHIDARLAAQCGPSLGMLNEFAIGWFDETSRWVDATLKTAATESPANAALLAQWVTNWRARTLAALRPFAHEALGAADAQSALAEIDAALVARMTKLGIPDIAAEVHADNIAAEADHV